MSDHPYEVSASGFRRLPPSVAAPAMAEAMGSGGFRKIDQPGSTGQAIWEGLLHGAGNLGFGLTRLFAKGAESVGAAPEGAADTIGRAAQQREQTFVQQPTVRAHPTATAIGETVGEMGASAPIGIGRAGAALWERLLTGGATGAAGGAVGAAATAPGGKEFMPSVGRGAALGAGLGAGIAGVGRGVRPAVQEATPSPPAALVRAPEARTWRDAARMLVSGGVRLSPGQTRNLGYKERSLQEWPILRNMVRGQVGRSVEDFDRAVVAQALSPIGAAVPRSVRAGHDLVDFGTRQLDQAYGRVLPNLSLTQGGVMQRLQNDPELSRMVSEMTSEDVQRLTSIIQNRVLGRWQGNPQIDGNTFKEMERDLSHRAATLAGGNSDEVGRALNHILGSVRDELAVQNPAHAADLQKINHAFAMWARVRAAAGRDVDGKGRFGPNDLLHVLRGEDPSSGGNSFARGREPMQAFAEAGSEVIEPSMGRRYPETSKSPFRMAHEAVGGALLAAPYGAAAAGQRIPGIDRAIGTAGPGVGYEAGKRKRTERSQFDIRPPPGPQ